MNYLINRRKLIQNILVIAAPAILEMALNTLLMVADTLMVSRLISESALSGVGIVNSIFFLLIFVFSSFNTGAVAMVSRSYGEKDMDKAANFAGNNLVINLTIGALITLLAAVFRNALFMPYEITAEVLNYGQAYFNIIIPGMLFQFGSFAFASMSRGVEDTRTPMYITGFANIFNIVFNYVLIRGVWFFPEMGIHGAALATTMARVIAFSIYLYIFISGRHKLKLTNATLRLRRALVRQLWKISYPGAIEQLLMQGSFFVMGIFITMLDTSAEALFRILISIESTSFMPAVGIAIATATLVGKSLGEKDIEKATDTGYLATIMGAIWGAIAAAMFLLFPNFILSMFTDKQELFDQGISVFRIMAFNQLFLTANIVMGGALRGAGDTAAVTRLTSLRLWLIFTPMSYVLIRFTDYGVGGVWIAEVTSLMIFLVFLVLRFRSQKWAVLDI